MAYIFGVFIKHVSKITREFSDSTDSIIRLPHCYSATQLLCSTLLVRAGFQVDLQTSVNRIKALSVL